MSKAAARRTTALIASLLWSAGHARAQCGNPALYELGGKPGPVCAATFGSQIYYEAVARGHFISIESSPLISGLPAVTARLALDHDIWALATEFVGRVWASDGQTLYALDTSNQSAPQLLGRITIPGARYIARLRVRGNYVYAAEYNHLSIIDATNPAAPVVRSTFTPAQSTSISDLEVVGSYAYLAISDGASAHSLLVLDISSPTSPHEVGRFSSGDRAGIFISKAPNLPSLYMLTRGTLGAVELWSIANPAAPALTAANTTLDPEFIGVRDEFKATNTAICYLHGFDNTVFRFATNDVQALGPPITLSSTTSVDGMGSDPPYLFVTRESGELIRINVSASPPVVQDPYLDVPPGSTGSIVDNGNGYSILTGPNDLYFFATPASASPSLFAHLKPDAGYRFGADLGLVSGDWLFVYEWTGGTPGASRVLCYHLNGSPSPSVAFQGFFNVQGNIQGLSAGADAVNGLRAFYTLPNPTPSGPSSLHILSATNPAAMVHLGSFALTSGVFRPVLFLNATFSGPPRVLVGGLSGATQIVSVASSGSPSSLGVIPSSSVALAQGLIPTIWLVDRTVLKAYDLTTPAAPALQSVTRIAPDGVAWATDVKIVGAFGSAVGVTTGNGNLVKLNTTSPTSPTITQIAKVNTSTLFSAAEGLAFDGTNIHIANGGDGYAVLPFNFSAPPREDPSHPLALLGPQGIVPICPGSPVVIPAHFVASPAPTAYAWFRYTPSTGIYRPLADGPTQTGSVISGSTTPTLTITGAGPGDIGFYAAQATNSCGSALTDTFAETRMGGYANCDNSTTPPVLNVSDFICFLNAFSFYDPNFNSYPNCDGSTASPIHNVSDFICFQQQYAAGCQ